MKKGIFLFFLFFPGMCWAGRISGGGGSAGSGDIEGVTAGSGLVGGGTAGTVTLSLDSGATHYIHSQDTLQSGATFYVSSGTVDIGGLRIHGTVDIDRPDLGTGLVSRARLRFNPNVSSNAYLHRYSYYGIAPAIGDLFYSGSEVNLAEVSFVNASSNGFDYQVKASSNATDSPTMRYAIDGNTGIHTFNDAQGTARLSLDSTISATASDIQLNGTSVCLEDGTNCPAASGGDNLGSHIATKTVDMAAFGINNIGTSSSSFSSGGGLDVASTATFRQAMYSAVTAFTASQFTMTSTHTIVTSSATALLRSTGTLPSAGSGTGQWLEITKVDTSTQPVIIVPVAGDTIVGLSTLTLSAYGSTVRLQAKTANTWYTEGFQSVPAFYGSNQDIAGAAAGVASTTYHQALYITSPCDTKQIMFNVGTDSGKLYFGLYDQYGKLILSSGPFSAGGTSTRSIAIPKVNLQPGLVYTAFGADNATITFTRYASNMIGAGMYSKSVNIPLATNIGVPPAFDNASTRSPALVLQCYGAAP